MRLPKLIRLAASKRTPLFNGPLECRLFEYKIVEGGMRRKKPEADEGNEGVTGIKQNSPRNLL
jgi:putative N6-adenine-specific DNA methylase